MTLVAVGCGIRSVDEEAGRRGNLVPPMAVAHYVHTRLVAGTALLLLLLRMVRKAMESNLVIADLLSMSQMV